MYLKEDVDARIQDLEAKVLSLDSQLMVEKMHARNFCDQRNYGESENKKLLRALWLARAKAAEYKADAINGKTVFGLMVNPKEVRKRRQSKLFKVKADEFKEEI